MLEVEKWTDKELIEVYDLQKRYAEKIVDFVRNGEENDVYKFLNLVPELHSEDEFKIFEKEVYKKFEFDTENPEIEVPQGRYIYKEKNINMNFKKVAQMIWRYSQETKWRWKDIQLTGMKN